MSFSSTPLGQGRRLDHHTFLNKPGASRKTRSRSPPRRAVPASYSYGAPTLTSRSPPHQSTALPATEQPDDPNEPALVRFARLKQRELARASTNASQSSSTTLINPEKWGVKDTSVNIAGAFNQAADAVMPPTNPNDAWASGARKSTLPRSTSVEYEKETQSTVNRRLAPPPSRNGAARVPRPVSKTASVRHVPDSEGEQDQDTSQTSNANTSRGKSPFEHVMELSKNLAPVAYLMRRRSQEPEDLPSVSQNMNGSANTSGGQDQSSSYDYEAEEREYQAAAAQAQKTPRRPVGPHKRNRMSVDNKAYRPTVSDLEESDEDFEDDEGKRTRRKKGKKGGIGGPLTTLPVAGYDKRRRRRKGDRANGAEDDDEASSDEQERVSEQRSQRGTTPVIRSKPPSRASIPRGSAPPPGDSSNLDTSMDLEQALETIPEADEGRLHDGSGPSFSIGASLGRGVNWIFRLAWALLQFLFSGVSFFMRIIGMVIGVTLDVLVKRPVQIVSHANLAPLLRYAVVGLSIYAAWNALHRGWLSLDSLPSWPSSSHTYHPPSAPIENMGDLSDRLQRLENALAKLSAETERADGAVKNLASDFTGRLGTLESRVQKDTMRALDAANKLRVPLDDGLRAMKQEVESIYAQINRVQREGESRVPSGPIADSEARAKLRALEEHLGGVSDVAKEALELGKSAVKVGASTGTTAAWWNKLATGGASGSSLTIKSSDGQDVTSLIRHLVHADVSLLSKDNLARPDFALHSAGARIIPSLTSDTLEIKPSSLRSQIVGLITGGNGYAIGRPPVTALHHEIHNGHCWPFAGTQGQLGVALSSPAYISDISIDHVPQEVATDLRSAPRQMEVWGLVEGRDNAAKVQEWRAVRAAQRAEALAEAELNNTPYLGQFDEPPYPKSLFQSPEYVRLANFTYNIHAAEHIQTFPVSQEIYDLGVDFGLVVLLVKSNWGRDEFTCLYRLRVHGEPAGDVPLPYSEDYASWS